MESSTLLYSGPEISVMILKEIMEDHQIPCIIKNNFQSGAMAGFYGGPMGVIDLYIESKNLVRAQSLLEEFLENQDVNP